MRPARNVFLVSITWILVLGCTSTDRVEHRADEQVIAEMKSTDSEVTLKALPGFHLGGAVADTDSEVTLKALSDFHFGGGDYNVDPYIRAAVSLQALGKDEACAKLLAHGGDAVVVLCRMLFAAKTGGEFRRPMIGGATFLGGTGYSDWPLEPIECVDGVPFLVTTGYFLAGFPEPPASYVTYCMTNCVWSSYQWRIPTAEEKRTALGKLLALQKWKRPLDWGERRFLSTQIEHVNRLRM
ncbi:hypothetical protein HQ590_06365 [bacterium]|nr:hypothetical protein [bacterium]